jgi:hypothetical protein
MMPRKSRVGSKSREKQQQDFIVSIATLILSLVLLILVWLTAELIYESMNVEPDLPTIPTPYENKAPENWQEPPNTPPQVLAEKESR